MLANELIVDAFSRVKEAVHEAAEGLSEEELVFRPATTANSIAWLVWHIARIQDDHIADLAQAKQVWSNDWYKRFQVPFDESATGYGQAAEEVAAVKADAELLLGYYDAVHANTLAYVQSLQQTDYQRIVDTYWDPPVTLAVRLVSIISDNLQHAGQAAYVRGLLEQAH